MTLAALQLMSALALGVIHVGTDQNVRVESMGSHIRVTAYGPAAHVPLLVTPAELDGCAEELAAAGQCWFAGRGRIVANRQGAAVQLTFSDSLDANVVDVDLGPTGLDSALLKLREFASGATRESAR